MNLFRIKNEYFNLDLLVRVSNRPGEPKLIPEKKPGVWELTFVGLTGAIVVSEDELDAVLAAIEREKLAIDDAARGHDAVSRAAKMIREMVKSYGTDAGLNEGLKTKAGNGEGHPSPPSSPDRGGPRQQPRGLALE